MSKNKKKKNGKSKSESAGTPSIGDSGPDSDVAGGTGARGRNFTFTINTFDEDTESWLQSLECSYLVYGYELAPTTGRPHLQGFVHFKNARYLSSIRKLFSPNYVVISDGSAQQNRDYCIKSGAYYEKGDIPSTSESAGVAEITRWDDARAAARDGRFDDIPSDLYIRYQNSFKRIRREDREAPTDLAPQDHYGVWIYGPPRTGKSHAARHNYGSVYLKDKNKWFDDYDGCTNMLIDEVGPEHSAYMVTFLKNWVDRWTFSGECKGGRVLCRPPLVIVTSNYSIDECFAACSDVDREALKSRFQVIHMPFKYVPKIDENS